MCYPLLPFSSARTSDELEALCFNPHQDKNLCARIVLASVLELSDVKSRTRIEEILIFLGDPAKNRACAAGAAAAAAAAAANATLGAVVDRKIIF